MTVVTEEQQREAAKRMHDVGAFMLPEVAKMCDDAGFDDIHFTCVMVFACVKGRNMLANSVMFDDRLEPESVTRIIRTACLAMNEDDDEQHHAVEPRNGRPS